MYLQPCDWREHDENFKYVIDVFGRNQDGDVTKVTITDFKPFFYLRAGKETSTQVVSSISDVKPSAVRGMTITAEQKQDAMRGFCGLKTIKVWKLEFPALWQFKFASSELKKGLKIAGRNVQTEDIFESNLPPYLKFFHQQNILPASPFEYGGAVCSYKTIKPFDIQIPLYVLSYDIEVYSDSGNFPMSSNAKDEIIQIGLSFRWSDDLLTSVERYVLVSGTCEKDDSLNIIYCKNEKELLQKFKEFVEVEDPDVIAGYNTFGFDDSYIAERCERYKLELQLGRVETSEAWNRKADMVKTEKKTFELASGKYAVRYFDLPGRLSVDLLLSIRREQNLDSYKLDNVASVFLRDKVVLKTVLNPGQMEIKTKSTRGLFVGNYVRFDVVTNTVNPYREGQKYKISSISEKSFVIETEPILHDLSDEFQNKLEWSFSKDDLSPQDMFKMHKGTAKDRTIIAKYCIQDCDLVLTLMAKLDTLVNARGMADVCKVPIDFIFLRGQGIKIYSAVAYNASKRNQIIMAQESIDGDMSYEGAVVLPPKIGMYLDKPVVVLDFNSLYPSNMIAFNISPDSLVYVKTYDMDGRTIQHEGLSGSELEEIRKSYKIDEISFDVKDVGRKTCGFAQPTADENTIGLLPLTLDLLLKKRKETRKLMETTEDEAQRSVLNGLQLAYKVVANSVYGQTGSRTSPIRRVEVAACTTAAGRERLLFAKTIAETEYGGKVIAGDTDSIFVTFSDKNLSESIQMGKIVAERITSLCRKPYKIEYEKTFFPFILFCRKRYMGLMYEDDITKCKRKYMGIALKRRDSAPIVKDIYGGALDILMEQRSLRNAQSFVQDMLVQVVNGLIPLEKFIITKQLRDDYKNPGQIAHRVLADRMEERDAGNKPQVGDRIAYIYVESRKDGKKQGDRIENIDYVRSKKLKPDTEFYISNQIQNPVAQLFALGIEQLEGYKPKQYKEYPDFDEEENTLNVLKQKEAELEDVLFLGASYLKKLKKGPMDAFFTKKTNS